MKIAHWLVPLVTLLLAGVITMWEFDQRVSPGPLHPAHAARAELAGAAGCAACHGGGAGGAEAAACGACHAAVHAQLGSGRGVHGALPDGQARACALCHSEHHGASTRLLDAHSFALAGIADVEKYDHAQVPGFGLHGRHAGLACRECHAKADDPASPTARYLGLTQACASCHADTHRGSFGNDCAACHGQEFEFRAAPSFRHETLPLRGGHAASSCVSCHAEDSSHAVAALRAQPQPTRSCNQCHQDPHVPTPGVSAPATLRLADTEDCARCHAATGWREAKLSAADHATFGFPLAAPHGGIACTECHVGTKRAERFLGRTPSDCRSCHRDAHAGQFDHEARYAQCTACHAADRFAPHRFDIAAHADTALPLTGAHAGVSCALCHGTVREGVRDFHGTAQACAACHRDVHAGSFDRTGTPREVDGRTGCARCHDTEAFTPVQAKLFDHGTWTAYSLTGAHAALACTSCHARTDAAAPADRNLGAAAGRACANCHADPHLGQFAESGRTDCARCHTETRFAVPRFDHARSTAFALDETHRTLACIQCHRPVDIGGRRVVRYKPMGTRCGDCHALDAGKVRR